MSDQKEAELTYNQWDSQQGNKALFDLFYTLGSSGVESANNTGCHNPLKIKIINCYCLPFLVLLI